MTNGSSLDDVKDPSVLRDSSDRPLFVSPYGHAQVTGSIAISCEYKGDLYVAVTQRPGETMTQAGTTMMLALPDGTMPKGLEGKSADASLHATALRSLDGLFGLTAADYPVLNEAPLVTAVRDQARSSTAGGADPKPGNMTEGMRQVGIDYGAHLGKVTELPELTGAIAKPTWLRVRDIEKMPNANPVAYHYNGKNDIYPKGTVVLPNGGLHIIQQLIEKVRDLPLREAGYDGMKGYAMIHNRLYERHEPLKVPAEQMGEEAVADYARIKARLNEELRSDQFLGYARR